MRILMMRCLFCTSLVFSFFAGVPDMARAQKNEAAKGVTASKAKAAAKPAWVSLCLKNKAGALLGCRIVQRIFLKNRGKNGLLLAVELRRPKGGKPYIHMLLPLGLALPAGVALMIRDGKSKKPKLSHKTRLRTCVARGCLASMPLTPKMLATMKASKSMRVLFMNNKKKTISVPVSLKGMTKAWDSLDKKLK